MRFIILAALVAMLSACAPKVEPIPAQIPLDVMAWCGPAGAVKVPNGWDCVDWKSSSRPTIPLPSIPFSEQPKEVPDGYRLMFLMDMPPFAVRCPRKAIKIVTRNGVGCAR